MQVPEQHANGSLYAHAYVMCTRLPCALTHLALLAEQSCHRCPAADMLSVTVFVTPAGTKDEGGMVQPAYLNFNAQLLGPPAPGMKVCSSL